MKMPGSDYSRNVKTVAVVARAAKQESAGAFALNTAPLRCADDRTAAADTVGSAACVDVVAASAEGVSAMMVDADTDVSIGSSEAVP